jgi:hypothetical protein
VTILDVSLNGRLGAAARPAAVPGAVPADTVPADTVPADTVPAEAAALDAPAAGSARRPGSRAQVCAAVLDAVRSVPGLRPASPVRPVRPEHARWMHWDPAALAVELAPAQLEVHLAATRLPLPVLLEQAAATTAWGLLPHRLVVSALDAGALDPANLAVRP